MLDSPEIAGALGEETVDEAGVANVAPENLATDVPFSSTVLPFEERLRRLLETETLPEAVDTAKYFLNHLGVANLDDPEVLAKAREYAVFLQAHASGDDLDNLQALLAKLEVLPSLQKEVADKREVASQRLFHSQSLEGKAAQFREVLQQRKVALTVWEDKLDELEGYKAGIEAKIEQVKQRRAAHSASLVREVSQAEEIRKALAVAKTTAKKTTLETKDQIVECQRLMIDIASLGRRL